MPIVPEYQRTDLVEQPLPGARQQAPYHLLDSLTRGPKQEMALGQAIERSGQMMTADFLHQQAAWNEVRARDAHTEMMSSALGILHDPKDGYLNKSAAAAGPEVRDATVKALSEKHDAILQGMDNDAQRQAASKAMAAELNTAYTKVETHFARQTVEADRISSATRLKTASEAATVGINPGEDPVYRYRQNDPTTQTAYQKALNVVALEAEKQAALLGFGVGTPESAEAKRAALQQVYASVINNKLAENKTGDAQLIFKAVKSDLDTEARKQIGHALESASAADNILKYSDSLFDKVKGEKAQMNQVRADFEAGKITAVERQHIEQRIEHFANKNKEGADKASASILNQALDWLALHPDQGVEDMPKPIYLGAQAKGQLHQVMAFAAGDRGKRTDPNMRIQTYGAIGTGAAGDVVKMSDTDFIASQRPYFSASDFGQLSKMRQDYKDGKYSPQIDIEKSVQTALRDAQDTLEKADLHKTGKQAQGSDYKTRRQEFSDTLRNRVLAAEEAKPGSMTREAVAKMAREMTKEVVLKNSILPDWVLPGKRKAYELTAEEVAKPLVIPPADRKRLADRATAAGIAPTEQLLQDAYKTELGIIR